MSTENIVFSLRIHSKFYGRRVCAKLHTRIYAGVNSVRIMNLLVILSSRHWFKSSDRRISHAQCSYVRSNIVTQNHMLFSFSFLIDIGSSFAGLANINGVGALYHHLNAIQITNKNCESQTQSIWPFDYSFNFIWTQYSIMGYFSVP